jgi:hypothetical protein
MSQDDIVGRVSAHYIALLIYTCFSAYTIQARFTSNGKIRREIQNPLSPPKPAGQDSQIFADRLQIRRGTTIAKKIENKLKTNSRKIFRHFF